MLLLVGVRVHALQRSGRRRSDPPGTWKLSSAVPNETQLRGEGRPAETLPHLKSCQALRPLQRVVRRGTRTGPSNDGSGCVTGVAAIVATVYSACRPLQFCFDHGAMTAVMNSKVDLVLCSWHESATRGSIVHFVITVFLGVLVDDEPRHWHSCRLAVVLLLMEKRRNDSTTGYVAIMTIQDFL